MKYLSAIGVNVDTLNFALELDCEELDRALEIPFYPRIVGFRVMAAVFSQFELPENTSAQEGIEVTKRFAGEKGFRRFIPVSEKVIAFQTAEPSCGSRRRVGLES